MPVRPATREDIPHIITLIEAYYEEAAFETPQVNREKCAYVLTALLAEDTPTVFFEVAEVSGIIVGALMGERQTDLWSDAEKVVEGFFYVLPSFRSQWAAGRLLLDFKKFAEERPCVIRVEGSMGIDDDHAGKLFKRIGWEARGSLYGAEAY